MDIVEQLMNRHCCQDNLDKEAAKEIERLLEALLHIAWGGIQSVDDAEKYARKILEENRDD